MSEPSSTPPDEADLGPLLRDPPPPPGYVDPLAHSPTLEGVSGGDAPRGGSGTALDDDDAQAPPGAARSASSTGSLP